MDAIGSSRTKSCGDVRFCDMASLVPNYARIFGMNLREFRHRRGLTQAALADRVGGLSPTYISSLEHGRENPTIRQCERFAAAVGMPLDVLFDPRTVRRYD